MQFAVIDTNQQPMVPGRGRGEGFIQALSGWTFGADYGFVRYDQLAGRDSGLNSCRGLILSGSPFDLALPDDRLDCDIYRRMMALFLLIREFQGPVLGICFGHQLMALGDEFDPGRTEFGGLRVRNMPSPPERQLVVRLRIRTALRFLEARDLWVQFNHKQEVVGNADLQRHYEIAAGTEQCPVHIMQHRSREWFGVQFHPEIGLHTKVGEVERHQDAVEDGKIFLQSFVRYCLQR